MAGTKGGMFAKDKEFGNRLDQQFALGESFIVHGVDVPEGKVIDTDLGQAQVALLTVEKMHRGKGTGERLEVQTIAGAIVDKCKEATKDDFPAVVELRKVNSRFGNDALVIQWVADYRPGSRRTDQPSAQDNPEELLS